MNNFDQIKNALQRIRHFNDLPDEIQQRIAASATRRHFDAGQVIYVEGEPAESVYILESGWVKATRMTREGREQAMMFLRPVEVFGDIAVFTGTTYPGTVVALEDVDVWVIPAKTILDLIPRHPALAMGSFGIWESAYFTTSASLKTSPCEALKRGWQTHSFAMQKFRMGN